MLVPIPAVAHQLLGKAADYPEDLSDPEDVGHVWKLPSSPITSCCYLDRDCDHIFDWAEADLAWAFRPYLIFSDYESYSEHLLVLYQASPIVFQPSINKIKLKLTYLFLFREEKSHDGDSGNFVVHVESTDPDHQLWYVTWIEGGSSNCGGSAWDMEQGDTWSTGDVQWSSVQDDGMAHFALYISYAKHKFVKNDSDCEDCWDGGQNQACGDGWEGLPLLGISLRDWTCLHDYCAGWRASEVLAEYNSLTDFQKTYSGNIGEIVDGDKQTAGMQPDYRFLFFPSTKTGGGGLQQGTGSYGYLGPATVGPSPSPIIDTDTHGIWGGFDSSGNWRIWDNGFPAEWLWDANHNCFCGGKGREGGECCEANGQSVTRCNWCDWWGYCNYCANGIKGLLHQLDTSLFPSNCVLGDFEDRDQDGIPKFLDCDDLNPLLKYDLDQDGACDLPVVYSDRPECNAYCDRGHPDAIENSLCHDKCVVKDNCIDLSWPPCAALKQALDTQTFDYFHAFNDLEECAQQFANKLQEDSDSNGNGDKCEDMALTFSIHPSVGTESHWAVRENAAGIKYRVWETCTARYINVNLQTRGGEEGSPNKRPLTLGACPCNGAQLNWSCNQQYCREDAKYFLGTDSITFPWAPIEGCRNRAESFLTSRRYDIWNQGGQYCAQKDLCRYKDSVFSKPQPGYFSVSWLWRYFKQFKPQSLEQSLCHKPDPVADEVDLRGRLTRLRVEFPNPPPGAPIQDDSWYASTGNYAISPSIDAATFQRPDVEQCTYEFWSPFEFLQVVIKEFPEQPNDVGPGPFVWQVVSDPLTGELATIGFGGAMMSAGPVRRISTSTGEMPPIQSVVWTSAHLDTAGLDLGSGKESAVIFYKTAASPPVLYMGLVDRPDNPWFEWHEVYNTQEPLPEVFDPTLLYHQKGNRLLLIGVTLDASGAGHPNTVTALNLADGTASRMCSLHWLSGLTNYSVAVDQHRQKAFLVGGVLPVTGSTGETVFEVWSYDLDNQGYSRLPAQEIMPSPRQKPALALDSDGNRLFVYGGIDASGAVLSDLWELSTITGKATLLTEGQGELGNVAASPVLLFDPAFRRLWAAGSSGGGQEFNARSLDLDLGREQPEWQEQSLFAPPPEEPGQYSGQIQYGRPVVMAYTVECSAAYGQVMSARLHSEEQNLKVTIEDATGRRINEASLPSSAIWPVVPGETYRLVVSTIDGYIGETKTVFNLEVNPVQLVEKGVYATNWNAKDIDLRSSTAFLACKEGLEAVDIASTESPIRISRKPYGTRALSAAVMGEYVVLGLGPAFWPLRVLDVRNPSEMTEAGKVMAWGAPHQISISGRRAYTAQGLFGVDVFDLEDPKSPELSDFLWPGGPTLAVLVYGGLVFAGHLGFTGWHTGRGVAIFRISAEQTEHLSQVSTSERPLAIRLHGNILLVAEAGWQKAASCLFGFSCWPAEKVEVFDISDPGSVVKVTELPFDQVETLFDKVYGSSLIRRNDSGFMVFGEEAP